MENTPENTEEARQQFEQMATEWKSAIDQFQAIGKTLENPHTKDLWNAFEEQAMPALKGIYGKILAEANTL